MPLHWGVLLYFLYAAAVSFALVAGRPRYALAATLRRAGGDGAAHSALARGRLRRAGAAPLLLLTGVAEVAQPLVFVPPVAINLGLAALFGRTLRRGREPLISMFARMERGTLEADLARYTRRLTGIWVGFFVGAALLSAVLSARRVAGRLGMVRRDRKSARRRCAVPRRICIPALALSAIPPRFTGRARAHRRGGLAAAIRLNTDRMRPILAGFSSDSAMAWRGAEKLTAGGALAAARRLAQALPPSRYAINVCDALDHFLVATLAALVGGRTLILPGGKLAASARGSSRAIPGQRPDRRSCGGDRRRDGTRRSVGEAALRERHRRRRRVAGARR